MTVFLRVPRSESRMEPRMERVKAHWKVQLMEPLTGLGSEQATVSPTDASKVQMMALETHPMSVADLAVQCPNLGPKVIHDLVIWMAHDLVEDLGILTHKR